MQMCWSTFCFLPVPLSCAHVAGEAPRQPAGGGQARLLALPDPGHTQTHSLLVQKPDAHLGGENGDYCWGWGQGHGVLYAHLQGSLPPTPRLSPREMMVGGRPRPALRHISCAAGLAVRGLQERDLAHQQRGGVRRDVVPLREQHPRWQHRGPGPRPSAG